VLDAFHPAVARWFRDAFGTPTEPQAQGWPAIRSAKHTLIAAPTGSGKTLAAFLCAIDALVREGLDTPGGLADEVHTLYVSPLKALGNDIEANLQRPLAGIAVALRDMGLPEVPIRTAVRTGDTPARDRARMLKRPPHLFVTTPESLYILLTTERGRAMLRTVRTVIVDEVHAVVRDKRGAHLALSLARLDHLIASHGRSAPVRVGLSATQNPIDEVARFLVGTGHVAPDGAPDCQVVDVGLRREMDLALELPDSPLEAVMSTEAWQQVYDRLTALIAQHRTTLVFVNTRRWAERVTRDLSERLGADQVAAHHGSLSRETRHDAESRLREGQLAALVATASLELGIDIGDVDLVVQLGSPRSLNAFIQRIGRARHHRGGIPKGRLVPLSRDDLVESVALLEAVRGGTLDRITIPPWPLDILAQQVVAEVASEAEEAWGEEDLYALVRRAYPYRDLPREDFDAVVRMLAAGFRTERRQRPGLLHRDAVNGRLRARRGARLTAITSGGAIPDTADYEVLLEPTGIRVGTVNEDFAIESMTGDVFQLGNTSYRIIKSEPGRLRVADAQGEPPSIPFWVGEAWSRSDALSRAVSDLRARVARSDVPEGLPEGAGRQLLEYLGAAQNALGAMPTQRTLVLERFFDEVGNMHLVVHSPYGGRINRAFGLALRKRFCRSFNVELQAAATEDAVVLSLGPIHSFPLEDVWRFLHPDTVRDVLVQALLDAPMFETRWRWNANRALAVPRFRGGKKVPAPLQRMAAADLLALVFPDQVACLENVPGDREIPDHPLVTETLRDCLHEAMDVDGLERLLRAIESGEVACLSRDLTEPSPLAQEILGARPYAFLDDAPLEERRTQAVRSRRWLDPAQAAELGALDPEAIAAVCEEAWPDPRDAEELHDALVLHGALPAHAPWRDWLHGLASEGRAGELSVEGARLWIAAERTPPRRALQPEAVGATRLAAPADQASERWTREDALREIVRGWMDAVGPTSVAEVARALAMPEGDASAALAALEAEGAVLRGRFRPNASGEEWCERRLLARIHSRTLRRLRAEIEPVPAATFMRFLTTWQLADPDARVEGPEGLTAVLERLAGFEAPASAWEADLIAVRMRAYDPVWLDGLCLAGRVAWARRTPARGSNGRVRAPVRGTPITIAPRATLPVWLDGVRETDGAPVAPSEEAALVLTWLDTHGAAFFNDVAVGTGLLKTRVEAALAELVSLGRVTADGYSGLRALLVPSSRRRAEGSGRRRGRMAAFGMESAGRWSALPLDSRVAQGDDAHEDIAWTLLRRWGVVFRRLLDREGPLPPWRQLVWTYRRLEARGEIRGGRFVAGFSGEQYALPEAIPALRRARREGGRGHLVSVSAADPLNLLGILLPGRRLPATAQNRLLLRDGLPVAVREGGDARFLEPVPEAQRWALSKALVRQEVPVQLRAYLG
jgi:ATP-dependent helicase Lhr and Lhr-like helicase